LNCIQSIKNSIICKRRNSINYRNSINSSDSDSEREVDWGWSSTWEKKEVIGLSRSDIPSSSSKLKFKFLDRNPGVLGLKLKIPLI